MLIIELDNNQEIEFNVNGNNSARTINSLYISELVSDKIQSKTNDFQESFATKIKSINDTELSRVELHNSIHNRYIGYVKDNRNLSDAYFKVTLIAIYSGIYNKKLVWKNIPIEADIQINLKKILKDTSYIKIYELLKYYSDDADKGILTQKELINLTALFYSSLYRYIKTLSD